ncbi:YbgA family protein [Thalassobacillus pellis]|uniref:YbgA family protein n=1 Tax=Thalassobacillus pellis TaxID=748008 RepID=UPI001960A833|nr:DUF523 and DUF1722 domain-containing protein [Thalassobacillus pellis]MBM7551841.1 uncharacterized protein YbgA (DUF1722 family)/uncharacterized protein YbbK (DUF523 family) [Thalassobacillus pellis]
MQSFATPRLVVSRCLEFDEVRYNGEVIPDRVVQRLQPFVEFIPVCPEVEIGLGVPREVIRIIADKEKERLVQPSTGKDLTKTMTEFSTSFIEGLPEVDGFLLKNRSPTCGINDVKVYADGDNSPVIRKTDGFFAKEILKKHGELAIEDEGRLKNFTLREHFMTKLFTLAAFREIKNHMEMSALIDFHSRNKYLFMAYNQQLLKEMGQAVANHARHPVEEVFKHYEGLLKKMMQSPATPKRHQNVCQHIFGYFKNELNAEEKAYFLDEMEQYEEEKIPLSTLLGILKAWVIRFDEHYLKGQTYFEPYPIELIEISDSGKGRAYT